MSVGKSSKILAKSSTRFVMLLAMAALLPGMQGRLGGFESRVLASHNRERAALGLPELKWDAALSRRAQAWADYLAANDRFQHSPNLPGQPLDGENIWAGTTGAFSPEDMVDLWIEEKAHFRSGTFPANSNTGRVEDVSHYTQVIWRRTALLGCGISQGRDREIMVCRYSEPGNLIGANPLSS